MARFNFPYHTQSTKYPDTGFRAAMGNSYQFSAPSPAPDQRIFNLFFPALKYFKVGNGLSRTLEPEINLLLLEDFYNIHKCNLTFTYPHPIYGDISVRFNKPLEIPQGTPGGNGVVQGIQIELQEQPGISDSGASDMVQIEYVDFL